MRVRPSFVLMLVLAGYAALYALSLKLPVTPGERLAARGEIRLMREAVARFGLTDLALSTEARYTRHPAVSDQAVVTMDHPGALDHFPSTLFWAPPR